MTRPVALLKSRVPRIFLLQELMFKSNSDHITGGLDSLPHVHTLLQEYVAHTMRAAWLLPAALTAFVFLECRVCVLVVLLVPGTLTWR